MDRQLDPTPDRGYREMAGNEGFTKNCPLEPQKIAHCPLEPQKNGWPAILWLPGDPEFRGYTRDFNRKCRESVPSLPGHFGEEEKRAGTDPGPKRREGTDPGPKRREESHPLCRGILVRYSIPGGPGGPAGEPGPPKPQSKN